MKLHIKLVGTFNRTAIDSHTLEEEVTPKQWMRSHFAVATEVRQRKPSLLRQRFGMDFLSNSSIIKLLEASQPEEINHSDLIPPWLQPAEPIEAKPILYRYEFASEEGKIQLQPDDPQLPPWETDSVAGTYEIVVEKNTHPNLSSTWLDRLWLMAKQEWSGYSNCARLKLALQFPNFQLDFYLADLPRVKVSIEIEQLPLEIQEATAFLRQEETELKNLSEAAIALIEEYQTEIGEAIELPLPQEIEKTSDLVSPQFIIGKRISRRAIEELIEGAEEFLLISSYIIEDLSITELICQKATTLPQGVWILTDLNNEVIDAIDTQVEEIPQSRAAYQHSDAKKTECLKLLLAAGVRIRGGAFHLKAYISETAAYLGSSNLTGGSLDFNLESGLICRGNTTHQDLLKYFTRCWQYKAKYNILPLQSGFKQYSFSSSSSTERFNSPTLLTPQQYRQDLYRELAKCSGRVEICSRGFNLDGEILKLLSNRPTHIYADGFIRNQNSRIKTHFRAGIHAKITLISDRVAYLGGINFQFAPRKFSLNDLMYKTSARQEINQIRQQLAVSTF